MFSGLCCSPCGRSIVSGDRLSLLTQGFSAPPSFSLACGSHPDPVSTLPLTQLRTVNWLKGPIPNSQERNLIDQLWSGAPSLDQSAKSRVCHVFHEAWVEEGLQSSVLLIGGRSPLVDHEIDLKRLPPALPCFVLMDLKTSA